MNPEIHRKLPYSYRAQAQQMIKRARIANSKPYFSYRFRAWTKAGAYDCMRGYRLRGGIGGFCG